MNQRLAACLVSLGFFLIACSPPGAENTASTAPGPGATSASVTNSLTRFASEEELQGELNRWPEARRRDAPGSFEPFAMDMADPFATDTTDAAPTTAADAESITNVQTEGVDEGGIVKRVGDHLVILRRGRLFTVSTADGGLRAVDQINASAPWVSGQSNWYDELLISGNRVVVVGYSYAREATELGLFELQPDGGLRYQATAYLRGNDHYSSDNYASRLVGDTLVFYTPLVQSASGLFPQLGLERTGAGSWPQLSLERRRSLPLDFQRILPAQDIYRADQNLDPERDFLTLHTVTRCSLAQLPLSCDAAAVLGGPGREFYVSGEAVYVWTTTDSGESTVLRLPLSGAAPQALQAQGAPQDQFSFLEEGGHLNVLLREGARATWSPWTGLPETEPEGELRLLRVPLEDFGGLESAAPGTAYHGLPEPGTAGLRNRFVGEWLLYSAGHFGETAAPAYAARYRQASPGQALPAQTLNPGHRTERIEALGGDAVLVGGGGGDLVFSAVDLGGARARVGGQYRLEGAQQGESRSHGFFYRSSGERQGVLGLPVLEGGGSGSSALRRGSAAVLYLEHSALQFGPLGQLAAGNTPENDFCVSSCVDWYGNARPIFLGERIFALLGYELVEGRVTQREGGETIEEVARLDFTPQGR